MITTEPIKIAIPFGADKNWTGDAWDRLVNICSESGIVGIDGFDGAGKTLLSERLAKETGADLIHIDDYLIKDKKAYVEFIQNDQLDEAITNCKSATTIVEGVCLLEIMQRCGRKVAQHIYVKRMSPMGIWTGEGVYFGDKLSDVGKDVDEYHKIVEPNRRADVVVELPRKLAEHWWCESNAQVARK
ncbi:MAG: hypothetical protein ACR2PG_07315 [Hyphomicrobiaceae bacterium]